MEPKKLIPFEHKSAFYRSTHEPSTEIVEGLIREGQLCTLAGAFGMGKSPLLAHLAVCLTTGRVWCGRVCQRRPLIVIDFENAIWRYIENVENIAHRLDVALPSVPEQLEVYLEHAPGTKESERLLEVMSSTFDLRIGFLRERLALKPNALMIIDPLEVLFELSEKAAINHLYRALRKLLVVFPHAAIMLVYNLRKKSRVALRLPNLLYDPQDWLEETCGHLNLLNRADVRLGIDRYLGEDDKRVINGVRRGELCHPLVIYPYCSGEGVEQQWSGFELCSSEDLTPSLENIFTSAQLAYWNRLPLSFRFNDAVGSIKHGKVPRASLWRLLAKARSIGIVSCVDDIWKKV